MSRTGLFVAVALLTSGAGGGRLAAQLRVDDITVTAGASLERYTGNFSVITVPIVDSTEYAIAGAGHWGFTGALGVLRKPNRTLGFAAEGTLRQLVAGGFQQRNYAPREHTFRAGAHYAELLAGGSLSFRALVAGRGVADLPPMPLYLPPGFLSYSGAAEFARSTGSRFRIDAGIVVEDKDYAGPSVLPDLDLLDYRSVEVRAGGSRLFRSSSQTGETSSLRFFAAYLNRRYPLQGHRRDHAARIGGEWLLDFFGSRGLQVDLSATGTLNRSNSSRVEYNAVNVETEVLKTLGDDYVMSLSGTWADKSYVNPQQFLVPGEEADNALILYGGLSRRLTSDVRATVGGGWARAETNISGDYYDQFRVSFELRANLRF